MHSFMEIQEDILQYGRDFLSARFDIVGGYGKHRFRRKGADANREPGTLEPDLQRTCRND